MSTSQAKNKAMMTLGIKVSSLNCNVARGDERWHRICTFVNEHKADVILLQEAHLDATLQNQRQHLTNTPGFFSHGEENRAGVAILFRQGFAPEEIVYKEILKAHLISVDFAYSGTKYRCINIYAPSKSKEREVFFANTLHRTLEECKEDEVIAVVGDWNCTLDPALDRNSPEPHPESTRSLASILQHFGFTDAWRLQHPSQRQYTWCRGPTRGKISLARLDRIYIYI